MKNLILSPKQTFFNICIDNIARDKSISHRSVIFSLLSDKPSKVTNFLFAEDTINTLKIALQLGACVRIDSGIINEDNIELLESLQYSKSFEIIPNKCGILEPSDVLYCGNAGTAMRLYIGLLSCCEGNFILTGDKYLRNRTMSRLIKPFREIGVNITARCNDTLAPIVLRGGKVDSFVFHSPVSSAQVKSAMILCGLQSKNGGIFSEVSLSRDHSERILQGMGASLEINGLEIKINPLKKPLKPLEIEIPSDPSSAFYFAVLASIVKNSSVKLKDVLLNKTRIEAFLVLKKMGAKVEIIEQSDKYERVGDIIISYGELNALCISDNIAWLIDEIPALSIACAFANGVSVISNASELRVKESDRITSTIEALRSFGVKCEERDDGMVIYGRSFELPNHEVVVNSCGDHRIAMSFSLFGAFCKVKILDYECINTSFPSFLEILDKFIDIEIL